MNLVGVCFAITKNYAAAGMYHLDLFNLFYFRIFFWLKQIFGRFGYFVVKLSKFHSGVNRNNQFRNQRHSVYCECGKAFKWTRTNSTSLTREEIKMQIKWNQCTSLKFRQIKCVLQILTTNGDREKKATKERNKWKTKTTRWAMEKTEWLCVTSPIWMIWTNALVKWYKHTHSNKIYKRKAE